MLDKEPILSTPQLDEILSRLPPPSLKLHLSITFNPVIEAEKRLKKKLSDGALTQSDIENELAQLDDKIGGMVDQKEGLVGYLRMALPFELHYDLKKLPL